MKTIKEQGEKQIKALEEHGKKLVKSNDEKESLTNSKNLLMKEWKKYKIWVSFKNFPKVFIGFKGLLSLYKRRLYDTTKSRRTTKRT